MGKLNVAVFTAVGVICTHVVLHARHLFFLDHYQCHLFVFVAYKSLQYHGRFFKADSFAINSFKVGDLFQMYLG